MNAINDVKPATMLRDLWYFALPASELVAGRMRHKTILGEPIVFGRDKDGKAFALRDICPHRGVPLSAGRMIGGEIECPYHGWRFQPHGQCSLIPSLVEGQDLDASRIRVRSYQIHEESGLVWIYMRENDRQPEPAPAPPRIPVAAGARPRLIEAQDFPCAVDHAVVGLMDPAHGPFVHNSWWWRGKTKPYPKAKQFEPSSLGFTMVSHKPSTNSLLYRILGGDLKTEISFSLPGLRIEHIRAGRYDVVGVTAVTPLEENLTEVTQTFFWTLPWLTLALPVLKPIAKTFLGQDRDMVILQQRGLRFNPPLMLIRDADVLAMWYYRLKKEWQESKGERRDFVNPVTASTLRWKS
ncbi:MAG: aromatic ring-hydroxylating dioxygenase subunit alpha [Alphaproteobacteria bacterium]|nr:aromatic ring-hydroxylating dioxygenase subunit alpha [Alphaproteobacteria bacterium]